MMIGPAPQAGTEEAYRVESDEVIEALTARVAELERRMDEVLSRIGYLPGEAPLVRDESQWQVDPDLVEMARSGKPKDVAKAIYEHFKRTGAEPEPAKQAVEQAAGLV